MSDIRVKQRDYKMKGVVGALECVDYNLSLIRIKPT